MQYCLICLLLALDGYRITYTSITKCDVTAGDLNDIYTWLFNIKDNVNVTRDEILNNCIKKFGNAIVRQVVMILDSCDDTALASMTTAVGASDTFDQLIAEWETNCFVEFIPKRADGDDDEIPSLQLGVDRFLSYFRGYRYQVSGTVDGQGDCGSSTQLLRQISSLRIEDGWNMLDIHAAHVGLMCQAVQDCKEFIKLFGTSQFDQFLLDTIKVSSRDQAQGVHTESIIGNIITCKDTEDAVKTIYIGFKEECCGIIRISPTYVSVNNFRFNIDYRGDEDGDLKAVQVCLVSLLLAVAGYQQNFSYVWKKGESFDYDKTQELAEGLNGIYTQIMRK